MAFNTVLKAAALMILLAKVSGYPGFRDFMPNGHNVVDPATGAICGPIGHEDCVAGANRNNHPGVSTDMLLNVEVSGTHARIFGNLLTYEYSYERRLSWRESVL
eukprot:scaffold461238_cov43-Prasinocladus_malaysianus.AAC.1